MSQSVTINSVSYAFPDVDEEDWGQTVTDWAVAVSNSLLQKTGGAFTLSAEVDFGASWGVKSLYISSRTVGVASAGAVRLAKTDGVYWRNNVGGADLSLGIGSDDRIEFNSVELVNLDAAQTLENKTLTSPSISGATLSGFATDRALKTDGSGNIVVSDVFAAEIDLLDGSAANTVVNSKAAIYGSSGELAGTLSTAAQANITSLGTLSGLTVSSAISGSITGNSATATKLAAAVNIGGTAFDGSVSIAVALAATATKLAAPVSIGMTGDVVWSIATFDGSGNVTSGATLAATQTSIQSAANLTTVGALDAGSISSGFGAINNGASGITSNVVTATTNIELDHQGSDPTAPGGANDVIVYAKDKKVYTRDGAGTVTELGAGGGGAGDADTIQLKTAEASEGTGSAPWYTGQDTVPGSDQGTLGGTWELSTSNPLINTNDATKVFHYSNGTSDRKGDYFEIELDVPNYAKGHNLVVQLFYRTVGAEDTDFLFFARDRTGDYETTTTTTGTTVNAFVVASATGFAVGDRICFEDGSGNRYFRYITTVASTTITFSGAGVTFAAGTKSVVSKFFTDELNFIAAENNTTNYEGKTRRWAFQINDTTTKVRVGFLYDNSATSTNELFFDQILLSSNQFLQVSSQGESESYQTPSAGSFWDAAGGSRLWDEGLLVAKAGSPLLADSKLITISDFTGPGSHGTVTGITAKTDIIITVNLFTNTELNGGVFIIDNDGQNLSFSRQADANWTAIDVTRKLSKDEYVFFRNEDGDGREGTVVITATPQVSSAILLNSQDEIFTDWVDDGVVTFVASGSDVVPTKSSTVAVDKVIWRRDGPDMVANFNYCHTTETGAASGTGDYRISLPTGYSIDTSKITVDTRGSGVGERQPTNIIGYGSSAYWGGDYNYFIKAVAYDATSFRMLGLSQGGSGYLGSAFVGMYMTEQHYAINIRVPIQGWTSSFNPVLSMPLVDFGTFENTYSARIANPSGTASITSQSSTFIASVNRDSAGVVTITFVSGFFSVAPTLEGTPLTATNAAVRSLEAISVSTTSAVINTGYASSSSNALYDYDFFISVTRQGADYRQPPQPTAAVIKPAVCLIKDVKAYNEYGGTNSIGSSNNWYPRTLNTLEGESWFVTLSGTSGFTLEPGTYEISWSTPFYRVEAYTSRLYDSTNSAAVADGVQGYNHFSGNYVQAESLGNAVTTIGSTTTYQIQYSSLVANTNYGLGYFNYYNSNSTSVYTQVKVRKLK